MDATYDVEKAKIRLSEIMKERLLSVHSGLHLMNIKQDPSWMTNYKPIYGGVPQVWRLTRTDNMGGVEEVVASVQGVLCKKDLPPFEQRINPSSKHVRHIRQSVSISGLGLAEFKGQVDCIPDVIALFARQVGEDNLQPNGIIGDLQGHAILNASNRYFTPKNSIPDARGIPIAEDVDPHGHLTKLLGSTYVYIEDNVVSYYERVSCGPEGDTRYIGVKPASVCVGDIIELQVSFIMIPLRDKQFKVTMVLRSILILDRTFTQNAAATKIAQQIPKSVNSVQILKRRVGYFDEELSTTRQKLSRMEVDGEKESEGHAEDGPA